MTKASLLSATVMVAGYPFTALIDAADGCVVAGGFCPAQELLDRLSTSSAGARQAISPASGDESAHPAAPAEQGSRIQASDLAVQENRTQAAASAEQSNRTQAADPPTQEDRTRAVASAEQSDRTQASKLATPESKAQAANPAMQESKAQAAGPATQEDEAQAVRGGEGSAVLRDAPDDHPVLLALRDYAAGKLDAIDALPVRQPAPPFRTEVHAALRRIPAGEVRSYAQLAAEAGKPGAVRAAGSGCATNLVALIVPCHRVVRTGGATGNYAYGPHVKDALLRHEGALKRMAGD